MKLKIVTPQGVVYSDEEITSITVPTKAGIINVMDDHEPIVSIVETGEIIIYKKDHMVEIAVSKGVLEIKKESEINILADTAERAEHIDIERAEDARKRAEEYLKQKSDIEDVEFARLQAKIEKELARINVGRRYRRVS